MLNYRLDLASLSGAYARGTLTPGAVVRDIFAELPRHAGNPIWIHLLPQEAVLRQVQAIEARRAAGETLPLFGVPFAVKDNIDVEGCPTTAACPAYAYQPAQTAFAVQRLLDAGALLIGKTNLDQFATGLVGTRSPYGACRNAFNADYISGGSSSGSAVAVALGLVSFALGTDTAGSGRVPAGLNNIVGLKPTCGVVSTRGVVPACRSLDCVSVFAATCEDAHAVLACIRSFDGNDIYARAATSATPAAAWRTPLRCGVPRIAQREFFGDVQARAAFNAAAAALRSLGAELVEIDFAPFAEVARLLYEGPWVAERYAAIREFFDTRAEALHPVTRQVIANAQQWYAADTFLAFYRLRDLKRRCDDIWQHIDVMVVPTSGTIYTVAEVDAAPIQTNSNLGYYTNFVNLLDYCALAVPGPFRDDGLPAGVTLIARAHQDDALAEFGSCLHRASAVALGATAHALPPPPAPSTSATNDDVVLAVVGAHLTGLPLNHQLTSRGARCLETTITAALYRLYALPDSTPPKPGLMRVSDGGAALEVELWALTPAAFGSFVASVPPPLAIGTVVLADGRQVKGFLCESWAVTCAEDISGYGGWRAYLKSRSMSETLYRGMDRAALDAAYDNTSAVKNSAVLLADFDSRSAQLRAQMPQHLDLRYGPAERNRIDYFAAEKPGPILVFIHGGYWQMRAKETFSFVATGPLAHGIHVALPGYTLAPAATLDSIVAEVRAALRWIAQHAGEFGGDTSRIIVSGWSAGGHLTAMVLDEPCVSGGLAISGIFDLQPIQLNYLNAKLGLDADAVQRLSPLFNLPAQSKPLFVAYGSDELAELQRQSQAYAAARAQQNLPGRLIGVPSRNHFTMLDELARADGMLTRLVCKLARA